MNDPHWSRAIFRTIAAMTVLHAGCGDSGLKPVARPPEVEKKVFEAEHAENKKALEKLEKKYGPNDSRVKQLRMEMGLEPWPTGPETKPGG